VQRQLLHHRLLGNQGLRQRLLLLRSQLPDDAQQRTDLPLSATVGAISRR
jgi:hypothetical protein